MALLVGLLADLHVDAFGSPALNKILRVRMNNSLDVFQQQGVKRVFVLGDLLHSPLPGTDTMHWLAGWVMRARKAGIWLYAIRGSHDTGVGRHSMLEVFARLGAWTLLDDGVHTLEGWPDGFFSVGVLSGRRGGLETKAGALKERVLPKGKYGMFLYHTAIREALPRLVRDKVPSLAQADFPKGWGLYAGGHLHWRYQLGQFISPGPLMGSTPADLLRENAVSEVAVVSFEKAKAHVEYHPLSKECQDALIVKRVDVAEVVHRGADGLRSMLLAWADKVTNSKGRALVLALRGKWVGDSPDIHRLQSALAPYFSTVIIDTRELAVSAPGGDKKAEQAAEGEELSDRLTKLSENPITVAQVNALFAQMSLPPDPDARVSDYKEQVVNTGCAALDVPASAPETGR